MKKYCKIKFGEEEIVCTESFASYIGCDVIEEVSREKYEEYMISQEVIGPIDTDEEFTDRVINELWELERQKWNR